VQTRRRAGAGAYLAWQLALCPLPLLAWHGRQLAAVPLCLPTFDTHATAAAAAEPCAEHRTPGCRLNAFLSKKRSLFLLLQVLRVPGVGQTCGHAADVWRMAQRAGSLSNRLCDRRLSLPHSSTSCQSPRA
jgi:hypothetical protein